MQDPAVRSSSNPSRSRPEALASRCGRHSHSGRPATGWSPRMSTWVTMLYKNVVVAPSAGTVNGMLPRPECTAGAVVLGPRQVVRDLALVASGGDAVRLPDVRAVLVGVLQPRPHALGQPIRCTAQFRLMTTGRRDDRTLRRAGDPVRAVVVVEGHRSAGVGERDVGPVQHPAPAVVLRPRSVDRGLVLVLPAGRSTVSFQIWSAGWNSMNASVARRLASRQVLDTPSRCSEFPRR